MKSDEYEYLLFKISSEIAPYSFNLSDKNNKINCCQVLKSKKDWLILRGSRRFSVKTKKEKI